MRRPPFRIERWYERFEFTTELMLSSSDCETVTVEDLLRLEPDARERLLALRLGYTEVPGSEEVRAAIADLYAETGPDAVVALAAAEEGVFAVETALLGPGDHADAFVARHADVVDWVRPDASPIGFPRLRVGDTQAFCERLAEEAGVLLLPGDVYDEPGHVRLGLGRLDAAEAFERLSAYLAA
jgi:aspartate/methionine/tyrosine aminotransferase